MRKNAAYAGFFCKILPVILQAGKPHLSNNNKAIKIRDKREKHYFNICIYWRRRTISTDIIYAHHKSIYDDVCLLTSQPQLIYVEMAKFRFALNLSEQQIYSASTHFPQATYVCYRKCWQLRIAIVFGATHAECCQDNGNNCQDQAAAAASAGKSTDLGGLMQAESDTIHRMKG